MNITHYFSYIPLIIVLILYISYRVRRGSDGDDVNMINLLKLVIQELNKDLKTWGFVDIIKLMLIMGKINEDECGKLLHFIKDNKPSKHTHPTFFEIHDYDENWWDGDDDRVRILFIQMLINKLEES